MHFPSSAVVLSVLSFGLVANAAPRGPGGPVHPPNCPYASLMQGRTRVFMRYWYDPTGIVTGDGGGYRAYTKDHFFNDFSITDKTTTYPKPQKGKKYPAPGKYANSRFEFADIHEKYQPKFVEIFGNATSVDDKPCFGDVDDNDCLKFTWDCYYQGTLRKPYGGKPVGETVSWHDVRVLKFKNFTASDDGQDYKIKSATVNMDWSSFYT